MKIQIAKSAKTCFWEKYHSWQLYWTLMQTNKQKQTKQKKKENKNINKIRSLNSVAFAVI